MVLVVVDPQGQFSSVGMPTAALRQTSASVALGGRSPEGNYVETDLAAPGDAHRESVKIRRFVMRYVATSLFGLFLFVGPAQAQDFCLDLCVDESVCTITATDALAALNAAVGLNPAMCEVPTTTLPGTTSTTTTTLPATTSTTTTSSTTTTTIPIGGECDSQLCAADEALSQECTMFLTTCLDLVLEGSEDECAAGALWICAGGICGRDACAVNEAQAQECRDFLGPCLDAADSQPDIEGCIGAALFKCNPVGCTSDEECDNGVFCDGEEKCGVNEECDEAVGDPCGPGEICIEDPGQCVRF